MEKSLDYIKRNYSALTLAYLGDSYYETLAREFVIADGNCLVSELNTRIKKYITAVSQSRIVGILLPYLDENETWFFKNGRNARNTHNSRSAEVVEYRRATGLECLYGYFHLSNTHERARDLFAIAIAEIDKQGS